MKFRLPKQVGMLAALLALTGCAMPPNAPTAEQTQPMSAKDALRTASASGLVKDNTDVNGMPLSFDTALASLPPVGSQDAKRQSLADAKPLDAADASGFSQVGKASWYGKGDGFHGRRTANGERFNMNELTAAHRTLPLASYVRVTNQANGKSVVVKINDRGPFSRGRILDLSYAAAKVIGLVHSGIARVKVQGLSPEEARVARADMLAANSVK
ncbi:septal ring lytic transglycosylase RlpA family protein [Burkholderia sp. TSV86]|uniref:septal ring lytic transglycosylase RlpA family protein n=1 Tax=Burkholderia sp. TSV86 TaxID=1385594 RepID=UPI000753FF13|nr:septal ring lytic transglycosylase RlpA family protein [Burkholderia sp. TSV86]KVE35153.1 hypothetical protein WS68_08580 [Burkholderia sp. TSV86]